MFLANIALARTQTKEEYGIFALSYSAFTFLSGLHNAAILEAYTVYGSGRYHEQFPGYSRLLWRVNLALLLGLTAFLSVGWCLLFWARPSLASRTILGMTLASGVLLSSSFVRRWFYMRRKPELAAKFSLLFFAACASLLWLATQLQILNGFNAFVIAAVSWCFAGTLRARELPGFVPAGGAPFTQPAYWTEHWKYSRWVLVTAFVFQLTTQAYYWLSAAYLSVKEVADLRAMYNLVTPVEQVFSAVTLLILPVLSRLHSTGGIAEVVSLWKRYCACWLTVTAIFAAGVNFLARPLMHMLYSGRFDDVAVLAGTLALVPVVMGIGNTMNAALKALEKPQAVFYAYLASGAATFVAGIPLITNLGLRGAIYGLLLSASVYSVGLGIAFALAVYSKPCASALRAASE